MTMEIIRQAQDYLTIAHKDRRRKIIDIQALLREHPTDAVIRFMKGLLKEKEKMLRKYVLRDRTNPMLDETVSCMWRLYMSIQVLEREVMNNHEPERGTGEGGELH